MSETGVVKLKPSNCASVPKRWLMTSIMALTCLASAFSRVFVVELVGVNTVHVEIVGLTLDFLSVHERNDQDWGIHDAAYLCGQVTCC